MKLHKRMGLKKKYGSVREKEFTDWIEIMNTILEVEDDTASLPKQLEGIETALGSYESED